MSRSMEGWFVEAVAGDGNCQIFQWKIEWAYISIASVGTVVSTFSKRFFSR
jgi:hypothetical protein